MKEKKKSFWHHAEPEAQEKEGLPEEEDVTVRNANGEGSCGFPDEEKTVRYEDPADSKLRRAERDDLTIKLDDMDPWEEELDPVSVVLQQSNEESEQKSYGQRARERSDTASREQASAVLEPVGWLVCIEGNDFGRSYPLRDGINTLGRSANMDIVISKDPSVSRNSHALVIYDEKSRTFQALPGEAKRPVYVNDDFVMLPIEMKARDVLCVGDTRLMLVPCCDETFSWHSCRNGRG
ncbi:MAG: FHA domain-containing protein [Lachnospiraceae bacterium]|nr:FHA domain-containing protein [Lachnospiraceae bacterium]